MIYYHRFCEYRVQTTMTSHLTGISEGELSTNAGFDRIPEGDGLGDVSPEYELSAHAKGPSLMISSISDSSADVCKFDEMAVGRVYKVCGPFIRLQHSEVLTLDLPRGNVESMNNWFKVKDIDVKAVMNVFTPSRLQVWILASSWPS